MVTSLADVTLMTKLFGVVVVTFSPATIAPVDDPDSSIAGDVLALDRNTGVAPFPRFQTS